MQSSNLKKEKKVGKSSISKSGRLWYKSNATKKVPQQEEITKWHFDPPSIKPPVKNDTEMSKLKKIFIEAHEKYRAGEAMRYAIHAAHSRIIPETVPAQQYVDPFGWKELDEDFDCDIQKCADVEYRIYYRIRKSPVKVEPCCPVAFHNTYLKAALTETLYYSLAGERTIMGATLEDCIRPGIDNFDQNWDSLESSFEQCGLIACDEECYYKFRSLFENVIRLIHPAFVNKYDSNRPKRIDLNSWCDIELPDFDEKWVTLLEIEIHRNLRRYKYPPRIDRAERRHVSDLLIKMLTKACKHRCASYDLSVITDEEEKVLTQEMILPGAPSNLYDVSAGLRRDWPDGRAIWLCDLPHLIAYLNTVDHLLLIAHNENGHLCRMVKQIGHFFQNFTTVLNSHNEWFAEDTRGSFGHLTTYPELLGPGVIYRAKIRLQKLFQLGEPCLQVWCNKLGLIVKNMEIVESERCAVVTVETKYSLGYDDCQLLHMFAGGIERLLKIDKGCFADEKCTRPSA